MSPNSGDQEILQRLSDSNALPLPSMPSVELKDKAVLGEKEVSWKFYFQIGVLLFALASAFFLWNAIWRVLECGPDEGMEFSKVQLLLHHPEMAKLAWNDQSWFYSQVFATVFRLTGFNCGVPRLATLMIVACLLAAFPRLMPRDAGWLHAMCGWLFFWCWPEMPHLAVSAMLEIPAIGLAVVAAALTPRCRSEWQLWRFCCAAILYAIAVQIKLTALIILPALWIKIAWVWWREIRPQVADTAAHAFRKNRSWLFPTLGCMTFALLFILIAWWSPAWSWSQLWESHLAADSTGQAAAYRLEPQYLLQSPGILVAAALGAVTLWRKRHLYDAVFPLVLLVTVSIIHFFHHPWWYYYGIHFAIPLAILGGWGTGELLRDGARSTAAVPQKRQFAFMPEVSMMLGALAISLWAGFELPRGYEDSVLVGQGGRIADNHIINELKKYQGHVKWAFSDDGLLIAEAGYVMPPELTVLPKKRFWTGNISNKIILDTVKSYQCEVLILHLDRELKEKAWSELVRTDYVNTWTEHNEYVFITKRLNPSPELRACP